MKPDRARLRKLLGRLPGKRVLVIGDVILDEYLLGDVRRISPEAPIPVFEVNEDTVNLGAAAYVASLVRHLGGEATLCGVIGDDDNGRRLRRILAERGIGAGGLLADPGRPTIIKTRVIARNQQMIRIDREKVHALSPALTARVRARAEQEIATVDAVICSDYDKGTFTPPLIAAIIRAAHRRRIPVAVNPKPHLALKFRGASIVSLNHFEAAECLKRALPDSAALFAGGQVLRRALGGRNLLITRREHGMALFAGGAPVSIPTHAREVFDGTGAGDTVIATIGLGLAAKGRLADCVHLANVAAGIEVGKLGCALVSPAEIRAEL